MLEFHVAVHFGVRVVAQGKVATIDVRPAEAVAMSFKGIEIGLQDEPSIFGAHFMESNSGGFGEGTTETDDFLKSFAVIDYKSRMIGSYASDPLKGRLLRKSIVRFPGS